MSNIQVKRIIKNTAVAVFAMVSIFSCAMEDKETPMFPAVYIDYGVVSYVDSSYFEITGDEGQLFKAVEYATPNYHVALKQRVKFNYMILSEYSLNGRYVYEIKVNGFDNIVSNRILPQSFVETDLSDGSGNTRLDSLGNDGIQVSKAAFSGDYINIIYNILVLEGDNGNRLINLVYEDRRKDTLFLTLHHNAFGVVPGKVSNLVMSYDNTASFEIARFVKDFESREIPVKLIWHWYSNQAEDMIEHSLEDTYERPLS